MLLLILTNTLFLVMLIYCESEPASKSANPKSDPKTEKLLPFTSSERRSLTKIAILPEHKASVGSRMT